MIIDKKINIKTSNRNNKKFKVLGYNCKSGDTISVNIKELSKNSRQIILVKCSNCELEKEVLYCDYNKSTNNDTKPYYCSKCKGISIKKTNQEKYGVDNVFQLNSVKRKSKETIKERYGVEHHLQNPEILEKQKKTNKEKYGVEFLMKSDKIKEKSKKTNLKKYGNEISSKSDAVKETVIKNNFKKYGVNYPNQLESIKNKIKNKKSQIILEKYKEDNIKEIKSNGFYIFNCENNHEFEISSGLLYHRKKYQTILCTKCNPINSYNISGLEIQLQNFIKDNYTGEIIFSNRDILKPYELDIYLPELNLSFEFNGVYWHNELNKPNDYHYQKTIKCIKKGIQLIHIYEDDWLYKKEIIKSRILNLLKKSITIYGRKTKIKEVDSNKDIRLFLDTNHIQGFVGSSIKLGLYYDNELVSLMTFGKKRKIMNSKSNNGEYELLRFCNKLNTNVIGGASKLFKYFIENYKYNTIVSYADRSWSNGKLYEKLGFKFINETKPNYYYIIDGLKNYRYNFRKDVLIKEGFDKNKTEHEIMLDRGIYRIYDSGSLKFEYLKEKR